MSWKSVDRKGTEDGLISGMYLAHSKKTKHLRNYMNKNKHKEKRKHNFSSYKDNENTRTSELAERRRTVLICDDERDLLYMFRIGLQESYHVLTAKSGEECIKNTLTQNIQEERLT